MESKAKTVVHVFDCDGVLLDSNFAKLDAVREVLDDLGLPLLLVEWSVREFRANFGRTRDRHFEIFSEYFSASGHFLDSIKISEAKARYGEKVELIYEKCSAIIETTSFISKIIRDDKIYVVSASDQAELRRILPSKITSIAMGNIFGGPTAKAHNIRKVMEIEPDAHVIFYGDAVQDAQASIDCGVMFLGLTKYAADPLGLEKFCNEHKLRCTANLE